MKNQIAFFLTLTLVFLLQACDNKTEKSGLESLKAEIIHDFEQMEGDFALAFLDLEDSKSSILINENEEFHAASTMKTPVMIEMFKQAAQGKFKLTDSIMLVNEFKSIVDGSLYQMDIGEDSGEDLYSKIGQKVVLKDLMQVMITRSSNLATNVLIEIVDAKNVTQTMRDLGAAKIEVLRGVEDIKAYEQGLSNSTTAKDLMHIMEAIANHTAGSKADCEAMIEVLLAQEFNDMIPLFLPDDVRVAHKTGSITGVHHDSGIVFLPNGKKYVLVILSKNLGDFDAATEGMGRISEKIYRHLKE